MPQQCDAVRGILDFIRPRFKGPIEIGEATVSGAKGMNVVQKVHLPVSETMAICLWKRSMELQLTDLIWDHMLYVTFLTKMVTDLCR